MKSTHANQENNSEIVVDYASLKPIKEKREHDSDNDPPYSRIFIVCGKHILQDEQLKEFFTPFGKIEYCKIIRDKATNESKGVAFVKYDKASSAAVAIESMNGKSIADNSPPLKVMIADAKGNRQPKPVYKEPEDTPPRSRLFILCSKEVTEEDLEEKFNVFGDLEFCKIMRDKQTGESKGFGYVKFSKASTAAIAMETVNEQQYENPQGSKLKALIADPKNKTRKTAPEYYSRQEYYYPLYGSPPGMTMGYFPPYGYSPEYGGMPPFMPGQTSPYPNQYMMPPPVAPQRLFVVCHKSVTQDELAALFSSVPGMEECELKVNKSTGESKGIAYVSYSSPRNALYARDQFNGCEISPRNFLKVMFAEPKEAMSNGLEMNFSQMNISGNQSNPEGPVVNYPEGSRLFIMLIGKLLPEYALYDVFIQFPGLEYVKLQKDQNFGYVQFSTAFAAQCAMNYLDGAEIGMGTRLQIQLANPPPPSNPQNQSPPTK